MLTKNTEIVWTLKAVENETRQIVAASAGKNPNDIILVDRWRSIGIDSLDLFAIFAACEQRFDIEILDSDAIHLTSAQHLIIYIDQMLSAQNIR